MFNPIEVLCWFWAPFLKGLEGRTVSFQNEKGGHHWHGVCDECGRSSYFFTVRKTVEPPPKEKCECGGEMRPEIFPRLSLSKA